MIFIDTNIAIDLRDNHPPTRERIRTLGRFPVISMITRIELENGVNVEPGIAHRRRDLLDRLLVSLPVEMFTAADISVYGQIVRDLGHDRQRTLDRLIAAQAIARDAVLITRNGKDFRKIDRLELEEW
ncbi:MAG: PIN domain-containing protein [Pseudomonadota bacterium]